MTADIEAEWRVRLRRLLLSDPALATELLRLLESLSSELSAARRSVTRNVVSGGVQLGPVIQSGHISRAQPFTPRPHRPHRPRMDASPYIEDEA